MERQFTRRDLIRMARFERKADAAIVERPDGRRYVLVVLTGGIQKDEDAYKLVSDLSRMIYETIGRR